MEDRADDPLIAIKISVGGKHSTSAQMLLACVLARSHIHTRSQRQPPPSHQSHPTASSESRRAYAHAIPTQLGLLHAPGGAERAANARSRPSVLNRAAPGVPAI